MSEPWATVIAHTNYVSGNIPKEGKEVYENIIKSCVKIQCKNELNKKVDRILFKQAVWGSAEMEIITRAFPKMKFIFNTRHPRSSIVSFYQMSSAPLFQSALKFQAAKLMQRLPPFPLHDQDNLCDNFRDNVLQKVRIFLIHIFLNHIVGFPFAAGCQRYARIFRHWFRHRHDELYEVSRRF